MHVHHQSSPLSSLHAAGCVRLDIIAPTQSRAYNAPCRRSGRWPGGCGAAGPAGGGGEAGPQCWRRLGSTAGWTGEHGVPPRPRRRRGEGGAWRWFCGSLLLYTGIKGRAARSPRLWARAQRNNALPTAFFPIFLFFLHHSLFARGGGTEERGACAGAPLSPSRSLSASLHATHALPERPPDPSLPCWASTPRSVRREARPTKESVLPPVGASRSLALHHEPRR